ncbi:MAG: hypothetical protein F2667_09610 [Actinobacteria bacterium]|uniref:Unannotated protein n=1 Tax=freshwater metagenome TaxID=449393 RepID=A0A6J6R5N5_9ZZZZ|nr:hypothetical protein [Actinomycetota bacterium]
MPSRTGRLRRVGERLISQFDRLVPAAAHVVAHSSPDLDDNVVALLRRRPEELRVVVLADDAERARARATALGLEGTEIVARHSRLGLWSYFRSRASISSHGLFGSRTRGRRKQSLGLWHGEFGKQIGSFLGFAPQYYDWVPVSSELARTARAAEFMLDPRHIHVVGTPRQQMLTSVPSPPNAGPQIVWVPTYRQSGSGIIRTDGDPDALDSLDLADPALSDLLDDLDATLWVRSHPLAIPRADSLGPRVRSAGNTDLEATGRTFYELLRTADCLVTDYSSVWVDFLLVDRPMIAFCPDLDTYRDDRGLALEPHDVWFPGPVVTDAVDLLAELRTALTGSERDGARRADRAKQLQTAQTDPIEQIWSYLRR